jgi:GntR family transcriptional regulator
MAVLRAEALIITKRRGSYVRGRRALTTVNVDRAKISARMPTDTERRAMRIDEGVPVLVITRPGHGEELLPADRIQIVAAGADRDTRTRSSTHVLS